MSRLESVVIPMAEKAESLQQKTSALSQRLAEANRIVKEMTSQPSQLSSQSTATSPNPHLSPEIVATPGSFSAKDFLPSRKNSAVADASTSPMFQSTDPTSPDMSATLAASSPHSRVPSPTPSERKRISEFSFGTAPRHSFASYSSDEESTTTTGTHRYAYLARPHSQRSNQVSLLSRETDDSEPRERFRPDSHVLTHMLPPPAIDLPPLNQDSIEQHMAKLSFDLPAEHQIGKLHRSSTTASQKARFESAAFRNAAILCDV